MAPRKGKVQKEEPVVQLGPQVQEGELVYGVAHIFASFNDTFVHVTDLSGRYILFVFSFVVLYTYYSFSPSYLGLTTVVLNIHFIRSPMSFTYKPAVLVSHSISFNHFFFGLPLAIL